MKSSTSNYNHQYLRGRRKRGNGNKGNGKRETKNRDAENGKPGKRETEERETREKRKRKKGKQKKGKPKSKVRIKPAQNRGITTDIGADTYKINIKGMNMRPAYTVGNLTL